jgi:hypothetical protein
VPRLASERVVVLQAILLPFGQPKRTVEVILFTLPCLPQAFGLEPFEVGQIAQRASPNASRNVFVVT